MDVRSRLIYQCLVALVICAASGCGYNQPSRFQMSFLPRTPRPVEITAADVAEVPALQPNLFLADIPAVLNIKPLAPNWTSPGDLIIKRAEQRFQRGKRFYQMEDIESARAEFDAAIDLMLQAGGEGPSDPPAYEKRLDEMVDAIHRYDLDGMGASVAVEDAGFEKAPLEDILQMTFPVDPKLKDKVHEQVAATVSQLPLMVNDVVLGYIHYFSGRGRKTFIDGMQRSGRYRPMIERILDEEGLPKELIHLAQAESGFIPRAVSRKAAGGMWQFVAWRGQQYGLLQTKYTDDRMDPEKATRSAARHLRDLYQEFGDWYLAMAAYNCGPNAIERAVEQTGYADFWELRNRGVLPTETTNYVPIILAMTIMEKNAAEYGLDGIQMDPPLEYDTVEMTAATNLALVSDLTDTPVPELLNLNPEVLKGMVPAGYSLHVPKSGANQLMAALQTIPAEHRDTWRAHRVDWGETLASISKRYNVPAEKILAANKLSGEAVEGDRLLIPAPARLETPAKRTVARASSAPPNRTPAAAQRARQARPAGSAPAVSNATVDHSSVARVKQSRVQQSELNRTASW
jgi:membrane-bound lytic murein transglycosylase D